MENRYCCDEVIMMREMKKRPNEILPVKSVIDNVHFIPREEVWKEYNRVLLMLSKEKYHKLSRLKDGFTCHSLSY